MKRRSRLIPALLLAIMPGYCFATDRNVSMDEYRQQLKTLTQRVGSLQEHPEQAREIESSIPDSETVSTSSGDITVDYRDLKSDLSVFSKSDGQKREALGAQLERYVHSLTSGAEAYSANPEAPDARKKLQTILARREFRHVSSEPGLVDILRAKIDNWLSRLFSRLGRASNFDWFQLLIYAVIGAALVMLLSWTVRRLRAKPDEEAKRDIIPFSPSSRSSVAWLGDARAKALQEDWRGAIHLAYWAAIAFLEERGSWRPNRARTPREYLRLLTTRNANYPSLAFLTRKLEAIWYGSRDAGEPDFQETLVQLEKLGCR